MRRRRGETSVAETTTTSTSRHDDGGRSGLLRSPDRRRAAAQRRALRLRPVRAQGGRPGDRHDRRCDRRDRRRPDGRDQPRGQRQRRSGEGGRGDPGARRRRRELHRRPLVLTRRDRGSRAGGDPRRRAADLALGELRPDHRPRRRRPRDADGPPRLGAGSGARRLRLRRARRRQGRDGQHRRPRRRLRQRHRRQLHGGLGGARRQGRRRASSTRPASPTRTRPRRRSSPASPTPSSSPTSPRASRSWRPRSRRPVDYDPAKTFVSDGLVDETLAAQAGADAVEGLRGVGVGTPDDKPATQAYDKAFADADPAGVERSTFDAQNFDAVVLCYLGAVAAGSTDGAAIAAAIPDLTAPGGRLYTWEQLPQAIEALQKGEDIDYQGASGSINMDEAGDATAGVYDIFEFEDGRPAKIDQVYALPSGR